MAHTPKPFFRTARNAWFVQLGARQIKLSPGPKSAASEKAAWDAFHRVMTKELAPPNGGASASASSITVAEVFDKYLEWCLTHRSPRTYEWSKGHIQGFCDHLRVALSMPAPELRPFHIVEWVEGRPTWGANQKRGAIVAIQRPFNWAAKLGYIERSPVSGVEKPQATKRESHLTPDDFATLLAHVKDACFRVLLTFAWESGVRP